MAPAREPFHPALVRWMRKEDGRLFLSVIYVAEVRSGIAKLARTGAVTRSGAISEWLDVVIGLFGVRVLPFDLATAFVAGELQDRARGRGHEPGFPDVAIGATAELNNLTVLTRNARHFEPLGLSHPVVNPFDDWPHA